MKELKEYRERLKLTQQKMAERWNISKSYYEKMESGQRKPGTNVLKIIKQVDPELDIAIFLN